jgi:hypothetical protein
MPKEIVTRRLVVYGAGSPYRRTSVLDVRIDVILFYHYLSQKNAGSSSSPSMLPST